MIVMLIALLAQALPSLTAAFIVWTIARVVLRRAELQRGLASEAKADERLARVEQAVDALTLDMERMSEGQRFTARLLADRPAMPAPRSPVTTPRP